MVVREQGWVVVGVLAVEIITIITFVIITVEIIVVILTQVSAMEAMEWTVQFVHSKGINNAIDATIALPAIVLNIIILRNHNLE